jgi:two-component system nitrate/nitrite response regulator NarL
MMAGVRIAVVDDHPLFREGVKRSLSEISDFQIVAEGSTKDDAVRISQEHRPDVMLLDISMPGGGLDAIPPILENWPSQKIVVLTVSETSDDVTKALNSGAKGYVLKGVGSRALAEIIRTVASGEGYVSPALSARLLSGLSSAPESASKSDPIAALTGREYEVLTLAAAGLSNKRIALKLDLHEKTVKHHMGRIFAKLNVTNRTEAAMALRDAGHEAQPVLQRDVSG